MAEDRILRIFISSPSDVRPERLIAERVVKRLAREFSYHFRVEPVLWEREPLVATHHFQDLIIPPHETDIVVTVLWSRLGVPLPSEKYRGAISQDPVTGTEWEFEDAMAGFRRRGLPDLLLYRKRAKITVELGDRAVLEEQQRQAELVGSFIQRWFRSADGTSFTAASWEFADATEFEGLLEEHLRALLRKRLTRPDDIETPATITWYQGSPYRGLESFEIEHAAVFFGRTRARNEVREALVRQLERDCGFVAVIGASGSGKSSLVKAAVLPDLLLPGMVGRVALCRYAITRPGAMAEGAAGDALGAMSQALVAPTALPELAAAPLDYTPARLRNLLDKAPTEAALPIRQGLLAAGQAAGLTARGEARLILVVDQLEELFTAGIASEARERYVAALDALARSGLVWVIATMRSDFFERVATLPALAALGAGEATYLLTPPDSGEIGQMIRRPAREAGLRFETDEHSGRSLDEEIREAAAKNPGVLPLLEYLLDQLWHRRSPGGVLTFEAYAALHGLEGAIGRRAEEVLTGLPPDVQVAFPSVLRTLVTVASTTAPATARLVPLSHFPEGSAARHLVEAFIQPQARILVADGGGSGAQVRIAHEALLTHWDRARQQIAADRRDIRARARLEEAEARWREAQPRDRDSLLLAPGLPLSDGEDLVARRGAELDPALIGFVEASARAVRDAERRRARTRRSFTAALGMAAVVAVAFAVVGWRQWQEAARANTVADTVQRLARHTSDSGTSPQRSLLLSVYAASLSQDAPTGRRLDAMDGLRRQLRATGGQPLVGHEKPTRAAAISSDGRWLATGSEDGAIRLWSLDRTDPASHSALIGSHTGQVHGLAFSPDDKWLASGGQDGSLRLWRLGAEGASVGPSFRPSGHGAVRTLAFSPGGEWLAFGTESGHVCVWRVMKDGAAEAPCPEGQHGAAVSSVIFSAKGRWLATAAFGNTDKQVRLWDLESPLAVSPPRALMYQGQLPDGFLLAIALSADETRLAVAYDYAVEVWDLTKEDPPRHVSLRGTPGGWIWAVDFSPDGRWLVAAGNDAKLWDLTSPDSGPIPLSGHSARVATAAFSADSRWLATAGDDTTVLLTDLRERRALSSKVLRGQDLAIARVVFSPGDEPRHLVALGNDRHARLWRVPDPAADPAVLRGHKGPVMAAALSADGAWIASSGLTDRELLIWSTRDPRRPIQRLPLSAAATAIAFSRDGRWLAASSDDEHIVHLWSFPDLSRTVLELPNGGPALSRSLGFSPDGRWLVSGAWDRTGSVRLWDVSGDSPSLTPSHACRQGAHVRGLSFSLDGRYAVTGEHGVRAHLWDLGAADPCGTRRLLAPHGDDVVNVAISRDARWVATASFDHKGRLWDVAAGREPRLVAEASFRDRVFAAAFSPDGRWVGFASWDNDAKLFDLTKLDAEKGVAANQALGFTGHAGRVLSVSFSPDNRWLVTSGEDRTARLWDPLDARTAPVVLRGHEAGVYIVGFLPDGRVVTHSHDETLMMWHLELSDLIAIACRTAGRELTTEEVRDFIGDERAQRPCTAFPKPDGPLPRR